MPSKNEDFASRLILCYYLHRQYSEKHVRPKGSNHCLDMRTQIFDLFTTPASMVVSLLPCWGEGGGFWLGLASAWCLRALNLV